MIPVYESPLFRIVSDKLGDINIRNSVKTTVLPFRTSTWLTAVLAHKLQLCVQVHISQVKMSPTVVFNPAKSFAAARIQNPDATSGGAAGFGLFPI